jgi:hypothetical protein
VELTWCCHWLEEVATLMHRRSGGLFEPTVYISLSPAAPNLTGIFGFVDNFPVVSASLNAESLCTLSIHCRNSHQTRQRSLSVFAPSLST